MEFIESNELMSCTGVIVPCEKAFKNRRIIILYFAASWSSDCKQFLINLKEIYTKSQELHLRLEVIYVSFDYDEETMKTYFTQRHGSWYAVPFGDPAIWVLRLVYGISEIPSMIVLDGKGEIISRTGMADWNKYRLNVLVAWNTTIPR